MQYYFALVKIYICFLFEINRNLQIDSSFQFRRIHIWIKIKLQISSKFKNDFLIGKSKQPVKRQVITPVRPVTGVSTYYKISAPLNGNSRVMKRAEKLMKYEDLFSISNQEPRKQSSPENAITKQFNNLFLPITPKNIELTDDSFSKTKMQNMMIHINGLKEKWNRDLEITLKNPIRVKNLLD